MIVVTFFIFLSSVVFASGTRQNSNYKSAAVRINMDLTIDGKLTEDEWKLSSKNELTFETQPGENIPAKQKTELYTLYNENYLYFGLKC